MQNLKQISILSIGLIVSILIIWFVSQVFYQLQIGPPHLSIAPSRLVDKTPSATPIPTRLNVVFIAFTATPQPTSTARPTPAVWPTSLPCQPIGNTDCGYDPAGYNNACAGSGFPIYEQISWASQQPIVVACQPNGYNPTGQIAGDTAVETQDIDLDTLETLYRLFRKHFWQ